MKRTRGSPNGWLKFRAAVPARRSGNCSFRPRDATPSSPSWSRGSAEGSPYLWDLIRHDPDRFLAVLESEPEAQFAALIAEVDRAGLTADNDDHAMRALRRGRPEAALLIALADIGGVWPVERVTRALTELADAALRAHRYLLPVPPHRESSARATRRDPKRAAAT